MDSNWGLETFRSLLDVKPPEVLIYKQNLINKEQNRDL